MRKSRSLLLVLLFLIGSIGRVLSGADRPQENGSSAPAQIANLIRRLQDDSGDWRDASKQLVSIGEPALLPLQKATRFPGDPDFRLRAAMTARAIYDVWYGELPAFGPPHAHVQCLTFLPDGRLLTGGDDQTLHLWDPTTKKHVRSFSGHSQRVMSVAASPNGKYALTGGEDKTVRLWDVATGREIRQFTGHGDWVMSAAFSADGKQALTCSGGWWNIHWQTRGDQTVRLWEVETGKELRRFTGHSGLIFQAVFVPGDKQIVSCSLDHSVRLWDAQTGKEIRQFTGHQGEVWSVSVSPDGKHLLSAGTDSVIRLWDIATGKQLKTIRADTTFARVLFLPDGKRCLTTNWFGADHAVRMWNLESGSEVYRFPLSPASPTALALSANGKRLATGDNQGVVRMWRLEK